MMKELPVPGVLFTSIVPPWAAIIFLIRLNPKPFHHIDYIPNIRGIERHLHLQEHILHTLHVCFCDEPSRDEFTFLTNSFPRL
jgi:hypothetical protein